MTTEMTLGDYVRVFRRRRKLLILVPIMALVVAYFYARSLQEIYVTDASLEIRKNVLREGGGFQRGVISPFERGTLTKIASNKEISLIAAGLMQRKYPDRFSGTETEARALADQIRGTVSVDNPDNSNIIVVSARGADPARIQEYCNFYARAIQEYQIKVRNESINELRQYLAVQIELYDRKIETIESELAELKRQGKGPDGTSDMTPEALTRVQTRLAAIDGEEKALADRRRMLDAAVDSRNLDGLLATIKSNDLRRDGNELAGKRGELAAAAKQYTDKHPVVESLREQVSSMEQALLEKALPMAEAERASIADQQERLALESARLKTEREWILDAIAKLPQTLKEASSKQRELGISTSMSQMFHQRLEELELSLRAPMDNLDIVEFAPLPRTPVYPNRSMIIVMGLIIGTMCSFAFAFLAEALDTSLTAMRDVERYIAKPILAVIPAIMIEPERLDNFQSPIKRELLEKLPLLVDHRSPAAEAFRTLRAVLQSRFFGTGRKTLLVTSSTPQEGKTTTTINLALACADAGLATVIVGANMRHPVIGRHFQIDRTKGLHDYLEGVLSLEEAVQPTGHENLSILDAGTFARRPAELLARPEFDALLARLKEHFDVVLVDSPPTLPVADAATMAPRVDGVLIVYLVSVAPRDALLRCKETLEEVGGNVIGVVFNDVWGASQDDYAGYYYHHKYAADELKRI